MDQPEITQSNTQISKRSRTAVGKRRSSPQLLAGELDEPVARMPPSELAVFHEFVKSFYADLKPVGPIEKHLVQSVAANIWRLNQARAEEARLLMDATPDDIESLDPDPKVAKALAMAIAFQTQVKAFDRISKLQDRLSRNMHRNITAFYKMRETRLARPAEPSLDLFERFLPDSE